jgi:hypothetical protein
LKSFAPGRGSYERPLWQAYLIGIAPLAPFLLSEEKRWLFSITEWNFSDKAGSETMHRLKCSPGASGAYFFACNSENAC